MTQSGEIRTVAVIGAGTMGSGIAQVFAQAGYQVQLHDTAATALERAGADIECSLSRFLEKGVITPTQRDETLGRLMPCQDLGRAREAELLVEAIVEQLEAKRALFRALDRIVTPEAVLSSNTSSISITALAACTTRPSRVVGLHFMNPVPLMSLVELVRGEATSQATMDLARDVVARLGKTAVESADYPGFIANRILMPMINEAAFALMEGVGSVEAIDTVMKRGMNHPMGPLALADLIGLDVCVAILDVMRDGLGDPKYRACPLLRRLVAAGHLGRKTGRGFYPYA